MVFVGLVLEGAAADLQNFEAKFLQIRQRISHLHQVYLVSAFCGSVVKKCKVHEMSQNDQIIILIVHLDTYFL